MKPLRIVIIVVLLLLAVLIGKIYYDTYTIEVRHYTIANTRLSDTLAGKIIAFVSDLHAKRIGGREKAVLSVLQRENPDIILLGGDYISFKGSYEPAMIFLNQLQNAYAVMGNTEYTNENGSCNLCHDEMTQTFKKQQGIRFLRNSSVILKSGVHRMNIAGMDDPVNKRGSWKDIQTIDHTLPTVLLAHSPEVFDDAVRNGVEFVLCGHNHGGQISIARYLKGAVLVDPSFDYMEGIFQKGNTVMYVSRGVGNSFFPFRLGVRPEVTIFQFDKNDERVLNQFATITNQQTEKISADFSIANVIDLFDFSSHFRKTYKAAHRLDKSGKLFDFESEAELEYLNWECHKWFELSGQNATSGKHSLRVSLPPGQYPGIYFNDIEKNWSGYRFFKLDLFNPSEPFALHVRIDDKKSGWEYADRFDQTFKIQKGMNSISIPLETVKANVTPRALNLRNIKRLMLFVPGNDKKRTFYIDNIRLE